MLAVAVGSPCWAGSGQQEGRVAGQQHRLDVGGQLGDVLVGQQFGVALQGAWIDQLSDLASASAEIMRDSASPLARITAASA